KRGHADATKAAKANEPAACPLGKECPPGELMKTGSQAASTSQGRARPTRAFTVETSALVATRAAMRRAVVARVSSRTRKGTSPNMPQPPPTTVTATKRGVAQVGEPWAAR